MVKLLSVALAVAVAAPAVIAQDIPAIPTDLSAYLTASLTPEESAELSSFIANGGFSSLLEGASSALASLSSAGYPVNGGSPLPTDAPIPTGGLPSLNGDGEGAASKSTVSIALAGTVALGAAAAMLF